MTEKRIIGLAIICLVLSVGLITIMVKAMNSVLRMDIVKALMRLKRFGT